MTVLAIHIGPEQGGPLEAVPSVYARAGKGLQGDRNFHPAGAPPGKALTLVEHEVVEDVRLAPGSTRRQITVRGVPLNDLVGKHFTIGEVECYGVSLCEPCLHLQQLTRPGLIKALVHRGGLRADILADGLISVGDTLTVAAQAKEKKEMSATSTRDYTRTVTIHAPRQTVFAALTRLEGLAGWWTPLVSGNPEQGGEVTFRFQGLEEQIVIRVDEAQAPSHVVWTCLAHTGHPEWAQTRIAFELDERRTEGALLRFRHEGLIPTLDCYDVCESGWETFLASIAEYAETGTGKPFN